MADVHRKSTIAAAAREPTPAMVYVNATCSGVSTSRRCSRTMGAGADMPEILGRGTAGGKRFRVPGDDRSGWPLGRCFDADERRRQTDETPFAPRSGKL